MPLTRRQFLIGAATVGAAGAAAGCTPDWMAGLDETPTPSANPSYSTGPIIWTPTPPAALSKMAAAASPVALALVRMTFGPRPGDVERVEQMGLDKYIDEQLHPESIDDSALDKMLESFPSLTMSLEALFENYPQPRPQPRPTPNPTPAPNATPVPQPTEPPRAQRPQGPQQIVAELQEATLLRALYGRRQLYEMMVDFWTNHFNIYIAKDNVKWMKTVDDREVMRKHALGKFKDLLLASAQSPAMLAYLDNRISIKGKPNENYAREVMELHTLGVDGGYTYPDIQNVARAFTGWTVIENRFNPTASAGYIFNARMHDDDEKTVLGVKIPRGGGEKDGQRVIEILANHPSTAKFLATKLVRRFVSDTPPDALVQRVAAAYQKTGGDIREMMSVILRSDEFKKSYGQKVRRPFEFLVSVLRALDVQVNPQDAEILRGAITQLGQPLFQWPTPDGYPDVYGAWINTNGMLNRWNLALNLLQPGPRGVKADTRGPTTQANLKTAADAVDFWISRLIHRPMSDGDRAQLITYLGGSNPSQPPITVGGQPLTEPILRDKLPNLVALVLSSPDYQYR
ncbi:MAG: DUF1800 domain-containing protein [Chloroflexi bacterium]|nr:DUF1800 domain-containing protein [Chloroflexota bacterium]